MVSNTHPYNKNGKSPERNMSISQIPKNSKLDYLKQLQIQYETDEQYQQCILAMISLQPDWPEELQEHNLHASDTETDFNETTFDAINAFIDIVYNETCTIEAFHDLYTTIAATVMSQDPQVGLVILFSFDHLHTFQRMLVAHLDNQHDLVQEIYIGLKAQFTNS